MRLIDGDAFRDLMQSLAYDDWSQGVSISLADAFKECARRVEEAPAVDVVPVVHGKWNCSDDFFESAICLICGNDTGEPYEYVLEKYAFCPFCGSKNG